MERLRKILEEVEEYRRLLQPVSEEVPQVQPVPNEEEVLVDDVADHPLTEERDKQETVLSGPRFTTSGLSGLTQRPRSAPESTLSRSGHPRRVWGRKGTLLGCGVSGGSDRDCLVFGLGTEGSGPGHVGAHSIFTR